APPPPPPAPRARAPPLPGAVNHAMAATLDGALYVAGGNDGTRPSTQLARLDGGRGRARGPPPQGRSGGGCPPTPRSTTRPPTPGARRPGCPSRASTWAPRPAPARCTWLGAGSA